jgi:hypothetical protein
MVKIIILMLESLDPAQAKVKYNPENINDHSA